ncbi:unnamed protein product [Polarella glacialis]|uniref:Protein kinase domain-containing protein n=1 Tax=Polarella glacialis TaxID=89957 RepID=A0A813M090_POLGL|nr:unnamed protein product [Polarella glacialis]CAE8742720.1 unnamed protein product [Polarella glacialis]
MISSDASSDDKCAEVLKVPGVVGKTEEILATLSNDLPRLGLRRHLDGGWISQCKLDVLENSSGKAPGLPHSESLGTQSTACPSSTTASEPSWTSTFAGDCSMRQRTDQTNMVEGSDLLPGSLNAFAEVSPTRSPNRVSAELGCRVGSMEALTDNEEATPIRSSSKGLPKSLDAIQDEVCGVLPGPEAAAEGWWRRGELIGSGTYGNVYMAQHGTSGKIFAVKVSRIKGRKDNDSHCKEMLEELRICEDLRHRHVVSCLGHVYCKGNLEICMEYVPGGSMRHILNQFGSLHGELLEKATRGIAEGLNYLHSHKPPIVHRDLKGANVLVDLDFCVKLADFGCAKRSSAGTKSLTSLGTPHWMAPEVFQHSCGHGRKADIWSLGCVVLEMATAEDPWGKAAFDNIMHAVRVIGFSDATPPIPEALPDSSREFVARCLQRDQEKRPWASELLHQPKAPADLLLARSGALKQWLKLQNFFQRK